MRISTSNMQSKAINQKRGPTTGNAGTASKRDEFMSAKSSTGSERSALADMVTDAVANRGRKMQSFRDAAVEPLKPNVNVGRKGSNKGNRA
jgi:hypothetical protein